MKVICYKRVSTDDQADRGFSLQHQEDMLLQWCRINKHEVVGIYTEDYSGKTFDRPEWKKLMNYIRHNKNKENGKRKVDIIICNRWDRFSRNQYDALTTIKELEGLGVIVNTVEQPLDMSNPDNKVLLSLYLTIPEVENDKNSIRTKEGSRRARVEGCWTGKAPRGYINIRTISDKKSTLRPSDESPIVVEAFEKLASGIYSADEVRRWMNSKGIDICKNQFLNLIRNIVYTGKIYVKSLKNNPELIVIGLHPPLVSDELFAAANDVLAGRKRKMVFNLDKSDLYPLKGLLKCEKHNLSLTGGKSKGRYGTYHYYHCTVKNDKCKRYPVDWVHSVIEKTLQKIEMSAGVIKAYHKVLEGLFESEDMDRLKGMVKLNSEIEKLNGQNRVIQEHLMNGKLTVEEYRELKTPNDLKIFEFERDLKELSILTTPYKTYINHDVPMLEDLVGFYRNSDGKTKKKILSCIFSEKVHFDENKDAAISFTKPIEILLNITKVLQGSKKEKEVKNNLLSIVAPQPGLEPGT